MARIRALFCVLFALVLPATAAAKTLQWVNVRDYGALCNGSNDDSQAFNTAINLARQVFVPAGDCVVNNIILHSDTELFGEGDDSVLYVPMNAPWGISANPINGGTPNPADNMRGIHLHDFQLRGAVELAGFAEQRHLLNLNAVSDVLIESMLFRGFRGDGIYIGSSNSVGVERHNRNITVRNSRFDGINKANRNAISAIDVDGLLIENNHFANTTRPDMPGAVDLEPNANAFSVIRNVTIRNNVFTNIGGNNGAVALYVPAAVKQEPQLIEISGNRFSNVSANAVLLYRQKAPTADSDFNQILISDNEVRGCSRPFSFYGVKGVTVSDNRFYDCNGAALLAYTGPLTPVREISLENNEFINSARADSVCLFLFTADAVDIRGNLFQDCARGGAASHALALNVGRSSGLRITGNRFAAPQRRLSHAIQVDARHQLDVDSNVFGNNQVDDSLKLEFRARPWQASSAPRP